MALVSICTVTNAQTEPGKESDTIRIGNIIITKNGKKTDDNNTDCEVSEGGSPVFHC